MEKSEGCGVQGFGVGCGSTFPKRPLSRTPTFAKLDCWQVLGDRATASMADADQLSYLKLCIRETLRLCTPEPHPRHPDTETRDVKPET
jgi:hypothetical protein